MISETEPATEPRRQKAVMIAATARITREGNEWSVPSQTMNGRYKVTMAATEPPRCTCPDHELRQLPCKHIFAVEIVLQREIAADGTITETRAARITYRQDWPAYNAAQTSEKEHFCRMLHDLCATVEEPAQTRGRPRLPLADRLFAAAFKVYSTMSTRRFMTDLRDAAGRGLIAQPISYNSVFKVIEDEDVTPILHTLITASALPLKEVELDFAVDSTGFGTSQFFRYYSMKYHHEQIGRHWIKCHAMIGTKTNVVTAVRISDRTENDSPHFPPLVETTAAAGFGLREVSADKAYSSRANLDVVVHQGAEPLIPFKSNARAYARPLPLSQLWTKLFHYFSFNREDFLARYHKRSNVESTFSMVKRVFGDNVRSRTPVAQNNEILLKILCHNIRCLVHEMHELGIVPVFERFLCPQIQAAAPKMEPQGVLF